MAAILAAGCRRASVRVYIAPKDEAAPEVADSKSPSASEPLPHITWNAPADWKETGPGQMSVASFLITDPKGERADVNITPLPMLAGRDAQIVNMWRAQVGAETLNDQQAAEQLQPVQIGSEQGKLFEVSGKPRGESTPMRIVTAMVHRRDHSWFFKLSGDEKLVAMQKPAFVEFLKTIHFDESAQVASSPSSASPTNPAWKVPDTWKQVAAGAMQVAKFDVPARDGAGAQVSASVFPNDTGGTLANVNRWRKQVGLPESDGLGNSAGPIEGLSGATLVDLTNNGKRLIGAIVPRDGEWWFIKLLGDEKAVTPERDHFVAFVKSMR
jgi:hypothetical protein